MAFAAWPAQCPPLSSSWSWWWWWSWSRRWWQRTLLSDDGDDDDDDRRATVGDFPGVPGWDQPLLIPRGGDSKVILWGVPMGSWGDLKKKTMGHLPLWLKFIFVFLGNIAPLHKKCVFFLRDLILFLFLFFTALFFNVVASRYLYVG